MIPREIGQLVNIVVLNRNYDRLLGTFLANVTVWLHVMSRSLLLALHTSFTNVLDQRPRLQIAGSIPTEVGELINLTDLCLKGNKLTGTPPPPPPVCYFINLVRVNLLYKCL